MSTEMVHQPVTALTIRDDQLTFTPEQIAALRQIGVEDANDADLAVFFHQAKRTGLDPFARQLYMVGRWDSRSRSTRYTIQTGIDGYRLIAARTGLHAGTDDAVFEYDRNGNLFKATVTVYKVVGGQRVPFTASALFQEYVQTTRDGGPNSMWARMGHTMLAKCAEALALRKAFPQDLAGIYTSEEMGQADNVVLDGPVDAPQVTAGPQVPDGHVSRSDAKQRVLDAAGGSADCARRVWGGITDEWIPEARVAELEAAARECADCQTAADDDVVDAEVVDDPGSTLIDERLMRRLHAVARDHDLDHDDIKAIVWARWALDSTKQLTVAQAEELISVVEAGEYDDEVPM